MISLETLRVYTFDFLKGFSMGLEVSVFLALMFLPWNVD